VQVVHDPAITALGAAHRHQVHVEAYFRDGSVERETRAAPRGSEQCFAAEAQIVEKFRKLTGSVMARAQQMRWLRPCSGSTNWLTLEP
jgi:hypothetical protein